MPDEKRKRRIEELIQRELGRILLKHPKRGIFTKITLTSVSIAADLSVAKVFFSVFDEIKAEEAKKMLQEEAVFLRKSLAHDLNLRLTPRLNFIYDESIKRGQKLSELIDAAVASDERKRDT
ncbi:MAG TPA: 30S ribosome-binding factor RbfA [Coxiellaceae bacterium]|nr:MAG: ribosome-binding factor A [Gammaproteobacteria bacterium RBG_16_37_9]HBC71188.1 30S ribosome-binding factor RbfA [Coxiellaceae bacterium]